ncbi:MAG: transcriptional regulator, partial [Nitrosopumilus sp.]|nr:transcriptional regulator [Nitrosopumilus sp.]
KKPAARPAPKAGKPAAKPPARQAEKPDAKPDARPAPKKAEKDAPKKPAAKPGKKPAAKRPGRGAKEQKDPADEKTLEEQMEEELTEEEIENFQIEKVDMERLTGRVCEILASQDDGSLLQGPLWKRLKLNARDGSRLVLKLERKGTIEREKLLENGRWTYRLILKKTPISTASIEDSPCLTCPVEQMCTPDGETSPLTCKLIDAWVLGSRRRE